MFMKCEKKEHNRNNKRGNNQLESNWEEIKRKT